jgi:hypothetical protein
MEIEYGATMGWCNKAISKGMKMDDGPQTIDDLEFVVRAQVPNGSWSSVELIDRLGANPKLIHEKVGEWGDRLVVTWLVVAWMQKHHNDKQYSLIIKKGTAWLSKYLAEKGLTEEQLKVIEPN